MDSSGILRLFAITVIGKEGVGKSQLISSLTGKNAESSNFKGSTISEESYNSDKFSFVDTPGIVFDSDSETTKIAISSILLQLISIQKTIRG